MEMEIRKKKKKRGGYEGDDEGIDFIKERRKKRDEGNETLALYLWESSGFLEGLVVVGAKW